MRMKVRNVLMLVFCIALAGVILAQRTLGAEQTGAVAPVFIPAADLKWIDLDPKGAPGVKVANLWGDHQKGEFGALFTLPAGFNAPLHTHTHEMKVVIVSGTYIQIPDGKTEVRLGPGSYMVQPGGNYRHTTICDKASDCVFFVESKGAFDLQPVAAGNAGAQLIPADYSAFGVSLIAPQ